MGDQEHSRTIIHIDIDCFYAQVEMVRNPTLRNKPLGINQKNFLVTSNYVAREYGVQKGMYVTEAKELCPNLVLVNGEDLYNYRQVSHKITALLYMFSQKVERLGLDENYVDVSDLVNQRLKDSNNTKLVGYKFGETETLCDCGCTERISVGSQIAQEIRDLIYKELQLTICAGIAHNKILAKLVGRKNRPNKQTSIFPNSAAELMLSLELVKNIPSIGHVTAQLLGTINISTVNELQNSSIEQLKSIFTLEKAETIWNLGLGIDNSIVKKTGKPQSIGLEDSSTCKGITTEKEIEDKFKWLLNRLLILVDEDGRIPNAIKVTVRKYDDINRSAGIRETKQCSINTLSRNESNLMNIIMTQFRKMVKGSKLNITLLGLSFTKFVEKTNSKNTLVNFFSRDHLNNINQPSQKESLSCSSGDSKSNTQKTESPQIESKDNDSSPSHSSSSQSMTPKAEQTTKLMCPPNISEEVFWELPKDIQEELWNNYKRKRESTETIQRPHKKIKSNSILDYLIKE